ncbi:hypothetical protein IIA15_08210 [candidate division TA06 bacterium]|nr:hypothetical protein [candidate division TA06 bacterium]
MSIGLDESNPYYKGKRETQDVPRLKNLGYSFLKTPTEKREPFYLF